jgi:hypothetical protein
MTLKPLLAALSVLALAACGSASAKPMTLACTSGEVRGPAFNLEFENADRVTVDFDAQTLHFEVSRTTGTANPVDWTYHNRKATIAGWPDDQITLNRNGEGVVYALALRFYTMFTVAITKSEIVVTAVSEKGIVSQARFRCSRAV